MKKLSRQQVLATTLASSIALITGCTGMAKKAETNTAETVTSAYEEPSYRDFDLEKDTLHDLLVAEIAAQRDQFNVTLLNYLQQAHITRDVEIIKRAINAAQLNKDSEALTEMALLWLEVEPTAVGAHQLLIFQRTIEQDYASAMHHIDKLIELEADVRVDSLALTIGSVPEKDKETLLKLYQDLDAKYPDNHEVTYSLALVLKGLNRYDDALTVLEPVFKSVPYFQAPSVLKSNLLYDKGLKTEAIEFAEDKFEDFPENHNLGRLLATMLIEAKRLEDAENIFQSLIDQYPQATRLQVSLGIVKLENNKPNDAKEIFTNLLQDRASASTANFYLARIADSQQDINTAIDHYRKVTPGPHFDVSLERYMFLLTNNERIDEAIAELEGYRATDKNGALKYWLLQVKLLSSLQDQERIMETLNAAIVDFPNDEQLVYTRAMQRDAAGDLAGMEADLRHLIAQDPKNAIALNALGYTLADKTDRLVEAFDLIQKAISLKPNNPAITDSMGWVLYKLGKNKEALVFLLKAFQAFQDGEIAAHLGEVLHSLGQSTEAREIWTALLIKQPEHKILNETVERLDPAFYTYIKERIEEARQKIAAGSNERPTPAELMSEMGMKSFDANKMGTDSAPQAKGDSSPETKAKSKGNSDQTETAIEPVKADDSN